MVRLPSKLARSLRPYEAVTSSSLEVNLRVTNGEVVSADNNNNNNNNTFRTSKSVDTSYDGVELVDHGESYPCLKMNLMQSKISLRDLNRTVFAGVQVQVMFHQITTISSWRFIR